MHNKNTCCFCFVEKRKEINSQLDILIDGIEIFKKSHSFENRKDSQNINRGEYEKMKMKAEEGLEIEEKRHEGEILGIEERKEPYHYIDVVISVDGLKRKSDDTLITLKFGFPYYLSATSGLGRFFSLITGKEVVSTKTYDIDECIGKKISYITVNKQTDRGRFANVQLNSIELI